MNIKKGEKTYEVRECQKHWSVVLRADRLTVRYEVDKKLCGTSEDLKRYVLENEVF